MDRSIKLSIPHLTGYEAQMVLDAVNSTWITPLGPYVDKFESLLGNYLGCRNVVALSSGTAAIHLALANLNIGKGDTVICQSMTFAASANPITYLGATPIFIDSESETWNMSPVLLEKAICDIVKANRPMPKAIIAVDLYGMPAKFDEICKIARQYDIPVVEDAAEALGSQYNGKKCGTICDFGTLSFNGNKMITTSGGGALICPDPESEAHTKHLATQAKEPLPYYYHTEVGYNYRLSNVSAAIGCAQMEMINERVDRRRQIHSLYKKLFASIPQIDVHDNPSRQFDSNFWLSTIQFTDPSIDPNAVRIALGEKGVESRLLWRPMHMQPIYENCEAYIDGTSERLFNRGLCLPSSSNLTDQDIEFVVSCVINAISL